MTNEELLNQLETAEGVTTAKGAEEHVIRKLADHIRLPDSHIDLLKLVNGVSVYGGYFRLFGCSSLSTIDMLEWNAPESWSFAWNKPLIEYWFFGETAWGDQYAYRRDELNQRSTPRVFFVEGITMSEEVIATDFSTFLEREFLRNAFEPYDDNIVKVRRRLGDLEPLEHIAYVPSPLITGDENVASVSKLDAVASMIISGDLCRQVAEESHNRPVSELQTYEDPNGRTRMRVVWR